MAHWQYPSIGRCLAIIQSWYIVNWTLKNKLQWNFNWNSYIFIKKMHLKMSTKWRPFYLILNVLMCYNSLRPCIVVDKTTIGWDNGLWSFNTLRPRRNGRHFPDDVFKCIFLNKNVWISLKIRLKLVPKVPINNIPALVKIMAWRRPGDKPLSEPMMVSLLTHICVTRPQWVKSLETNASRIFIERQWFS